MVGSYGTYVSIATFLFIIVEMITYNKMADLIGQQTELINNLAWDVTKLEQEVETLKTKLSGLDK